jgi:hypothetical protein
MYVFLTGLYFIGLALLASTSDTQATSKYVMGTGTIIFVIMAFIINYLKPHTPVGRIGISAPWPWPRPKNVKLSEDQLSEWLDSLRADAIAEDLELHELLAERLNSAVDQYQESPNSAATRATLETACLATCYALEQDLYGKKC